MQDLWLGMPQFQLLRGSVLRGAKQLSVIFFHKTRKRTPNVGHGSHDAITETRAAHVAGFHPTTIFPEELKDAMVGG